MSRPSTYSVGRLLPSEVRREKQLECAPHCLIPDTPSFVAIAAATKAVGGMILCLHERGEQQLVAQMMVNLRQLTHALTMPLHECELLIGSARSSDGSDDEVYSVCD